MSKCFSKTVFTFSVAFCIIAFITSLAHAEFTPAAETAYAAEFIQRSDGQQWFLDAVERELNRRQKSINTTASQEEMKIVTSISSEANVENCKIPSSITELSELKSIIIQNTDLSEIPKELYELQHLQTVDLSNNKLNGTIPRELGEMDSLENLILSGNGYNKISQRILENEKIKDLDISNNSFNGEIPVEINKMKGLEYLNLSLNNWSGGLPELSNLTKLEMLSAYRCGLNGLDSSIFSLTNLRGIDLGGNRLSGEIPKEFANLPELQLLILSNNNYSSELPKEFANLKQLEVFDLSNNQIGGEIPDIFEDFDDLSEFNLQNNKLRGIVPDSLKKLYDNGAKVLLENNYLTGENLKNMKNNSRNFADGAANQYKIEMPEAIRIDTGYEVNLLAYAGHAPKTPYKPRLSTDQYEFKILSNASKVKITRDEKGIYAKALEETGIGNGIKIQIWILGNDGSKNSMAETLLTTSSVHHSTGGSGGGGGGGGSKPEENIIYEIRAPYMNGFLDNTFRPDEPVTREQAAKMIAEIAEIAPLYLEDYSFSDLDAAWWSSGYIEAVSRAGYLNGYLDGTFRPSENITRAEFVTLICRVFGLKSVENPDKIIKFSDIPGEIWYSDYVQTGVNNGILNGYLDGSFRPDEPITRAEAAKVLNGVLGYEPNPNGDCGFPDVKKSHWAYGHIVTAVTEQVKNSMQGVLQNDE